MQATIGITAGDPAGIGLEVVLKSISSFLSSARWVLFTDRVAFERNVARFGAGVEWRWIEDIPASTSNDSCLWVRDVGGDSSGINWGILSAEAGQRALAYLKAASTEALAGRINGIVTAPVSKE